MVLGCGSPYGILSALFVYLRGGRGMTAHHAVVVCWGGGVVVVRGRRRREGRAGLMVIEMERRGSTGWELSNGKGHQVLQTIE